MSSNRVDARDIATGRWKEILSHAGIDPAYLTKKNGPCPLCGGTDRFRFINDDDEGHYYCNNRGHCGPGRGMNMLMSYLGVSFPEACDFIREWAGIKPSEGKFQPRADLPPPTKARPEQTDEELRAKYQKLWDEGISITEDTAAWRYLKKRFPQLRIDQIPPVLRAIRGMKYFEKVSEKASDAKQPREYYREVGVFDGMLALVQGEDDEVANVWRWWLTAEGDKAPVESPKKAAGRFLSQSWAVRLAEPSERLLVSEGVETALGSILLRGFACWATTSEVGMCRFSLPRRGYGHVKRVDPFGDNDAPSPQGRRAGNEAAMILAKRMREVGLMSVPVLPLKVGMDFSDIAKNVGVRQFNPRRY